MSRINQTDKDFIQTGKTIDLSSQEYGYLGGEFLTNSGDYIEVHVYNKSGNFLERSIISSADYLTVDGFGLKLKTGTILRKLGYDRGKFIVKYNFLRKVAGSYETVLLNTDGSIYEKDDYIVDEITGNITDSEGNSLLIKEYKYLTHEISPSRQEVRLMPQNIKDATYLRELLYTQKTTKRIQSDSTDGALEFVTDNTVLEEKSSHKLRFVDPAGAFSQRMVGGAITIPNAFITDYYTPPDPFGFSNTSGTPFEEYESETLVPRFYIVDNGAFQLLGGDINLVKLYERFKVIPNDEIIPSDWDNVGVWTGYNNSGPIRVKTGQTLRDVKYLGAATTRPSVTANSTLTFKSNSGKPDIATTYEWEITGWDWDKEKNTNAPKDSNWRKMMTDFITVKPTGNQTRNGLLITDKDSTTGSEISISVTNWNLQLGLKLTISTQNDTASIHIPAFVSTDRS